MHDQQPIEFLQVEDNPGDIILLKIELENLDFAYNIHTVKDGEEAQDFLYKRNTYANSPTPHLILLDLNIPKINGHELLKNIRNNQELLSIPVIVLTSSRNPKDLESCQKLGANAYFNKSLKVDKLDFFELIELVKKDKNTWIDAPHSIQ